MIAGGKNNLIGISGKMGSGKDLLYNILCELSDVDFDNKKFAYPIKWIIAALIGCDIRQLEDRDFKDKELGEEWWYCVADDGSYIPYEQNLHKNKVVNLVKLTPRKLLQLLGTEAGRQIIHPNIWVNALFADYKGKYLGATDDMKNPVEMCFPNWIITDVRFPNEVQAIKDRGGIVIRVNRDSELEYNHTDEDVLDMLNGMGYEDIDDDFSEEAINEGFRWSETLEKWSSDENDFQEHPSETSLDDYEFDYVIENEGSIDELVQKIKQLKLV